MRDTDHLRHGPREGLGGFLDPPDYPTHTYSIGSPNGVMAITYAIELDYVSATVRDKARELIAHWYANRPPLDSEPVKVWIAAVQRHYRGMGDAATVVIRKFYPEYQPQPQPERE